jgi:ribokinase
MNKVVVIGSFNMDMVARGNKIPKPGETVMGRDFFTAHGGKGANQAVACARMGADVTFVCRVGSDSFGDAALKSFKNEKIRIDFVTRDPKLSTGVALIIVDDRGENSIIVVPGANGALTPREVTDVRGAIEDADVVLAQLETPVESVAAVLELAAAAKKRTVLNPAPACDLPDSILKNVSILTPNETEAELLTGVVVNDASSAERAARALQGRGVETVLITMGRKGVYLSGPEGHEMVPAFEVKPIDTTAAGDVFSGALCAALAEGQPLKGAVGFASKAAAISVMRLGAQPSIPRRHEVNSFGQEPSI